MTEQVSLFAPPAPVAGPCADCERARAGMWGTFDWHCLGCRAREVARSLHAFNALDERGDGDAEPLRELIQRVLDTQPYPEARRAVWDWWQTEHQGAHA